jgi:uncharacterized membrane protein
MTKARWKLVVRWLFTLAVGTAGVLHLVRPDGFVAIVPAWLPSPQWLVYFSGVAEIAGAVGLQAPWPDLRPYASYGLVALFIAVFPANVNMAMNDIPMNGKAVPPLLLWGRLPLQAILIWLAWWCTSRPAATRRP